MPNRIWFRNTARARVGIRVMPATWEGWATFAAVMLLGLFVPYWLDLTGIAFAVPVAFALGIAVWVLVTKTDWDPGSCPKD